MSNFSQWPDQEKPRERLLTLGAEALSDAELLAILLRLGSRGQSALDLAQRLLKKHNGLRPLLHAPLKHLRQTTGIGPAKYAQLQAAVELGRRYLKATLEQQDILHCPEDVHNFLRAQLRDQTQEIFACLFLSRRNQLIQFEKLFHGSLSSTCVYPREIVKRALHHNAGAIIIAHNHPSGFVEPSAADRDTTLTLKKALALVDIQLLDHFIIGSNEITSFCELGLL